MARGGSADFATPARRPPDYAPSEVYGQAISLSWPLVRWRPAVDEAIVAPRIEGQVPLRHYFRHIFDQSRPGTEAAAIGTRDLPLVWSYGGLEHGIPLMFPGVDGYPEV
ncbi:MAG: hypothetical protein U5S82_18690 [Gammaproteobacteria bacterium]|nr:hypothetical protein [Gammaproteobacteria bacterium]